MTNENESFSSAAIIGSERIDAFPQIYTLLRDAIHENKFLNISEGKSNPFQALLSLVREELMFFFKLIYCIEVLFIKIDSPIL